MSDSLKKALDFLRHQAGGLCIATHAADIKALAAFIDAERADAVKCALRPPVGHDDCPHRYDSDNVCVYCAHEAQAIDASEKDE